MADAPTKPPETPTTIVFKFDEAKFQEAVIKQEKHLESFVGKKGHNPFFQLNELNELRKRYSKGERTEVLHKAAMAYKQEPPSFGPTPVAPAIAKAAEPLK